MSDPDRTKGSERKFDAVQGNPPPPDDRSPPELDEAILKASRRAVRFHWFHVLLEKLHLTQGSSWQLLVALAVGMLAGVGLETLTGEKVEPVPSGVIHAGDPPLSRSDEEGAETRSPEFWLRHIAALVLNGQIAEAESELRVFRQSYPDYEDTARPEPPPRFP
jgi:hypothetical protein